MDFLEAPLISDVKMRGNRGGSMHTTLSPLLMQRLNSAGLNRALGKYYRRRRRKFSSTRDAMAKLAGNLSLKS